MKLLLAVLVLNGFLNAAGVEFDLGKKIYEKNCLLCHSVDGMGNKKSSFNVDPRNLKKTILDEEQFYEIIKKGAYYHGAAVDIMPSYESVLSELELRSVAKYIAIEFDSKSGQRVKELMDESEKIASSKKAKMLKVGKKIFSRNCSICHGITGNGQSDYVEQSKEQEDFIYPYNLRRTLLKEDQIFLYAKFGGQYWGTIGTDMPSWSRKYDDFQLKSVAKYVYEYIKE